MTPSSRQVAILIFDEVEVLDFCGPLEVFGVAGEVVPNQPFEVFTVAETSDPVKARNRLSVNPNYSIANCPKPDILLVPGGMGTRTQMHNPVLMDWIKQQAQSVELLLSVCTGALLLGKLGLLDGLPSTTHHTAFDLLQQIAPHTTVLKDKRIVDNGQIILSGGISAGIDMSLYVVTKLIGDAAAQATITEMEYGWHSSNV
jgi:transcriptional regulator GlxA family with amidase domain